MQYMLVSIVWMLFIVVGVCRASYQPVYIDGQHCWNVSHWSISIIFYCQVVLRDLIQLLTVRFVYYLSQLFRLTWFFCVLLLLFCKIRVFSR